MAASASTSRSAASSSSSPPSLRFTRWPSDIRLGSGKKTSTRPEARTPSRRSSRRRRRWPPRKTSTSLRRQELVSFWDPPSFWMSEMERKWGNVEAPSTSLCLHQWCKNYKIAKLSFWELKAQILLKSLKLSYYASQYTSQETSEVFFHSIFFHNELIVQVLKFEEN